MCVHDCHVLAQPSSSNATAAVARNQGSQHHDDGGNLLDEPQGQVPVVQGHSARALTASDLGSTTKACPFGLPEHQTAAGQQGSGATGAAGSGLHLSVCIRHVKGINRQPSRAPAASHVNPQQRD